MPLYHFAHADAREQVAALESSGEKVEPFAADESGVYVYVTPKPSKAARAKRPPVETR